MTTSTKTDRTDFFRLRDAFIAERTIESYRVAMTAMAAYFDSLHNEWLGLCVRAAMSQWEESDVFEAREWSAYYANYGMEQLWERLSKAVCLAIPAQISIPYEAFGHLDVVRRSTNLRERYHSAKRLIERTRDAEAMMAYLRVIDDKGELYFCYFDTEKGDSVEPWEVREARNGRMSVEGFSPALKTMLVDEAAR